jgi:hypothetical protein
LRQLETSHERLEDAFAHRVTGFARWLSGKTSHQRSGIRDGDRRPSLARECKSALSGSPNGAPGVLHPAYVLTAGLVFQKMLERSRDRVPALESDSWSSKAEFEEAVHRAFHHSARLEPNFVPLLSLAAQAARLIPGTRQVLTGIRTFLEELDQFPLECVEPVNVGTVFESLIPWVERHQQGQFYTPPFIAEVLVRWALRQPTDHVLDPACGAGIILAEAYKRLKNLANCASSQSSEASNEDNIFDQMEGLDTDIAAIRLAGAALAMQVAGPHSKEVRLLNKDFFRVTPLETTTRDSLVGDEEVTSGFGSISLFDAVVTNPPYTRWSELPQTLRRQIQENLGPTLRAYHLTPRRGWGVEAGLHIYFALWAHRFLRPGGRLAMILSDSWLQTDFGTAFGRFLLDHFKVCAVVDLGARVFSAPTVGACLLLLEREDDPGARAANTTRFIHLNCLRREHRFDVERMLQSITGKQSSVPDFSVRQIAQRKIPRNSKWIQSLFGVEACLGAVQRSAIMTRLGSLVDATYGNNTYLVLTSKGVVRGAPNAGGEAFFYLTDRDARTYHLSPPWLHPLLPSARYAQFFRFTKSDWLGLQAQGVRCWLFTAHHSRKLPRAVSDYVRRGEREIWLRQMKRSDEATKTVSESFASSIRRSHPEYFAGWFDLGTTESAPIFAVRGAQYRPHFVLTDFPVGLDDRLIALTPRAPLDEQELKALVVALNSTFTQLQIEATCRSTGGGMVELDLRHAAALLIPDVRRLASRTVTALATLFDKLEQKSRQVGGIRSKAQLNALTPVFDEIDAELTSIMRLSERMLRRTQELSQALAYRRLCRSTSSLTMQDASL